MLDGIEITRGEREGVKVFPVIGNENFPTGHYAWLTARKPMFQGELAWSFGFDPDLRTEEAARKEFEEELRKALSA